MSAPYSRSRWRWLAPALLCAVLCAASLSGALAIGGSAAAAGPALTGLRVAGNQLVGGTGQPVRLRGVNRSGTEYACIQGWGFHDGPNLLDDSRSVPAIAAWGANAIRVPLNEHCWLERNGAPPAYAGAEYRDAIRRYVDAIAAGGLYAILDLQWTGAGNTPATSTRPMLNRDHSVEFWRQVATAYANHPNVIFDLHNEPYPDNQGDGEEAWRCWRDGGSCRGLDYQAAGMQEVVDVVRAAGADNLILLGGVQYANSLTHWLAYKPSDPANNLAASVHIYDFNIRNTVAEWEANYGPVLAASPVVVGEFGQEDCGTAWRQALLDWLDARGASYLAWTWNTWGDGCADFSLVTDIDAGTPTSYGQFYRDRLAALGGSPPPPPPPAPPAPPPPSAPSAGGSLLIYDDGPGAGFWDGAFAYSSRTLCDTAVYRTPACAYAVAFDAWGGLNFGKEGGFSTAGYAALEWAMRPGGQPLGNFSALLTSYPAGAVLGQVQLTPAHVVATLPDGWLHLSVPLGQLNPDGAAVYSVQLKNYTSGALPTVWYDEVRFVAPNAPLAPPAGPTLPPAGPVPTFCDVSPSTPYYEAIAQLASRGIIHGYANGCFGPADTTLRAQMAALIARAMGWDAEDHGNTFPDQGPVDFDLWRNVGTLAFYNVAQGYQDGTYKPTRNVLTVQAIGFITRAMVAKGYWQPQPDNPALYRNVPAASGHREDLATYYTYAGAVPETDPFAPWPQWDRPATRGWFAQALWQAFTPAR